MARDKRVEAHEADEKKPCVECRAELALLQRARDLQEQEGLQGRELVEGVMKSLGEEAELEQMWERKTKTPKRSPTQ